jgi:hypothetical protein
MTEQDFDGEKTSFMLIRAVFRLIRKVESQGLVMIVKQICHRNSMFCSIFSVSLGSWFESLANVIATQQLMMRKILK